jgi:hypothetical protein
MRTPPAIRIDNNLASSHTSITLRPANNKLARRLQMVHSLVVQILCRNDSLDYFLHQLFLDIFKQNISRVLGGDDDRVDLT